LEASSPKLATQVRAIRKGFAGPVTAVFPTGGRKHAINTKQDWRCLEEVLHNKDGPNDLVPGGYRVYLVHEVEACEKNAWLFGRLPEADSYGDLPTVHINKDTGQEFRQFLDPRRGPNDCLSYYTIDFDERLWSRWPSQQEEPDTRKMVMLVMLGIAVSGVTTSSDILDGLRSDVSPDVEGSLSHLRRNARLFNQLQRPSSWQEAFVIEFGLNLKELAVCLCDVCLKIEVLILSDKKLTFEPHRKDKAMAELSFIFGRMHKFEPMQKATYFMRQWQRFSHQAALKDRIQQAKLSAFNHKDRVLGKLSLDASFAIVSQWFLVAKRTQTLRLCQKVHALSMSNTKLEQECREAHYQCLDLRTENIQLKKGYAKDHLQQKRDSLKQVAALEKDNSKLRRDIDKARRQRAELIEDVESCQCKLAVEHRRSSGLEKDNSMLRRDMDKARRQRAELIEDVEACQGKLVVEHWRSFGLQREVDHLRQLNHNLLSEVIALRRQEQQLYLQPRAQPQPDVVLNVHQFMKHLGFLLKRCCKARARLR